MDLSALTLLVPDKPDVERDALAAAWEARGGTVLRLGRFWDPPPLDARSARVYGGSTFGMVLAERLGLTLVSPADRLLADVPAELLGRNVAIATLDAARAVAFPRFVKPVVPKLFAAAVYASAEDLAAACVGLDAATEVYVSDVIELVAEARSFVLDGGVRACSVYEGAANVDEARAFAQRVAQSVALPSTCVLDVGLMRSGRWVLIEANATWGAGLNGCDPVDMVDCVAAAIEA